MSKYFDKNLGYTDVELGNLVRIDKLGGHVRNLAGDLDFPEIRRDKNILFDVLHSHKLH